MKHILVAVIFLTAISCSIFDNSDILPSEINKKVSKDYVLSACEKYTAKQANRAIEICPHADGSRKFLLVKLGRVHFYSRPRSFFQKYICS